MADEPRPSLFPDIPLHNDTVELTPMFSISILVSLLFSISSFIKFFVFNINASFLAKKEEPLSRPTPERNLLPIACCLLPVACRLLPVACCLLPVAYCLLPVASPISDVFSISI